MLHLAFSGLGSAATVLCIGAHCDDIEIGCGATLIRLSRENPGLSFVWGVFAGDHKREQESRSAASELLGQQRRGFRNPALNHFNRIPIQILGNQLRKKSGRVR